MRRIAMFTVALIATLSLALLLTVTGSQAATKLTGTVGPGFTIDLRKGSTKVTSLKAGTYTILVTDRSSIHNWRRRCGSRC